MKILYVANIRIPTERAHGAQIMNVCHALASQGVEVVLCVPTRKNHIATDAFAYYQLEKNFMLERIPVPDLSWMGNAGFYLNNIFFAFSVLRYVRSFRPDVIYGRDEVPLLWLSYRHPRVFWESHGGKWNPLVRWLGRRAKGVVAITEGTKRYFVQHGIPGHKFLVAPDGVGREFFSEAIPRADARARIGLPADAYLAMYIGVLDAWKGCQTLLAASAELLKNNIQVVIIGGFEHEIKELAPRYPHALFLGFLPYADLAKNQRAADVLVIPNSGRSEISRTYTSPLKLFAHMASGVPLVVSDLPAFREIVDESDAYFVTPDDPGALVQAILHVRQNREEATVRAHHARERARQYTWDERARRIIAFLQQ